MMLTAPAAGQTIDPPAATRRSTPDEITDWIAQLSHDDYAVRQAAADRLLAEGAAAERALVEMVDAPDPEIRAAARRLITLIEKSEFDRRLEEFAADTDGRRGMVLPGWIEFGRLVGTDEPARALFVDMQRQEAALLAGIFGSEQKHAEPEWEQRLFRLYNWQLTSGGRNAAPPLGSCATMLFLSSLPDARGTERGAIGVAELTKRPPIRDALLDTSRQPTIRKLLLAWVNGCPVQSQHVLSQRLELMSLYGLSESLPTALAAARGEPPFLMAATEIRVRAILLVGRFGSEENVVDLEPLLDDTTVVANQGLPGNVQTVQLRDVALAAMLHLTGQPLADYGFNRAQRHPLMLFHAQTLVLESDTQRATALAKWREWQAEHRGAAG
jgi:hypothetical protein